MGNSPFISPVQFIFCPFAKILPERWPIHKEVDHRSLGHKYPIGCVIWFGSNVGANPQSNCLQEFLVLLVPLQVCHPYLRSCLVPQFPLGFWFLVVCHVFVVLTLIYWAGWNNIVNDLRPSLEDFLPWESVLEPGGCEKIGRSRVDSLFWLWTLD